MEEKKDFGSDLGGAVFALSAAIGALIKTHPDPVALRAALHLEHQSTLAWMTANPITDRSIESFHAVWQSVGPADLDG